MIAPGLYTIDAASGFLDGLAAGLLDVAGGDPAALTRLTVYLPTRRAARSLREAFLRAHGGQPMLLPRLQPIGGLDEDEDFSEALDLPPALPPLRRQLLLARLVQHWSETAQPAPLLPGQATALAGELGRFLDEVQAQVGTLDKERLASLVPGEHAEHWGLVLRFLDVMTGAWPGVLASQGALDRIERWNRAVAARIAGWQERPPAGPVVAAGVVGGLPAIDRLLAAILDLPRGYVVLPGLDRAPHDACLRDPTHPQFALLRTLRSLRRTPESIPDWPAARRAPDGRAALVARAMLPA
jgi:ATP-dependent helicase/nuclease subunit B